MTQVPTARQPGAVQGMVLLLQCTLAVMGTAILAPTIPKLIANFHDVARVQFWAPFAITVPSLCVAVSASLAGWLADVAGRRRLLMTAIACYGLVGILPYFLPTLPQIIASRILLGVFEATIMTVSTTLIGDYFSGRERDKWLGGQTAVASISAVVLLAVGGYIGDFGWRAPFLLYLLALPLLLLVVFFVWEPQGKRRYVAQQMPAASGWTGWTGFPWKMMAGICALTLVAGVMFYIVQIYMGVALQALGITTSSTVGLLTAAVSIGIPAGTQIFQRCSAVPIKKLLAAEFLLIAVGFVGMSYMPHLGYFVVFVSINQIGSGMILPTMLTWAMRQLGAGQRGRGIGIWQAVFALGPPLGPAIIAPLMAANGGHILPTFQVLGWAAALCAAGALLAVIRPSPFPSRQI